MITRHFNFKALNYVAKMRFGGHHQKAYDWRDDPTMNQMYEQDHRQTGLKDPMQYTFPHTAPTPQWLFSTPTNYNQKDLTQNFYSPRHVEAHYNNPSVPQTDWLADIAHEKDYESEDLDFQPESFETQHFRKKGPIYMWIFVGALPMLFFGCELFFQGWSDEDAWRYQRPPPLHWPDEDDTPDADDYLTFQTKEYNEWWDAGILKRPYFYIKDGKKIYYRHAGVNQPAEIPEMSS